MGRLDFFRELENIVYMHNIYYTKIYRTIKNENSSNSEIDN